MFDQATSTVTLIKDETEIKLTIGKPFITINGVQKPLDVPALIINGRTLVPARAVSEAFNAKVNYDKETQMITIEDNFAENTASEASDEMNKISAVKMPEKPITYENIDEALENTVEDNGDEDSDEEVFEHSVGDAPDQTTQEVSVEKPVNTEVPVVETSNQTKDPATVNTSTQTTDPNPADTSSQTTTPPPVDQNNQTNVPPPADNNTATPN
jgi:hypothetical protein